MDQFTQRTPPKYQPIANNNVPIVELPTIDATTSEEKGSSAATARVIAGELEGVKGPADTFSPVELWDIKIPKANSILDVPFVDGHNCIVFCRQGAIEVVNQDEKSKAVGPQAVALMEQHGDVVRIKATEDNTSVLIMGGRPLNEPIAARGPFVMNTWEEIQQANIDYMRGRFGA